MSQNRKVLSALSIMILIVSMNHSFSASLCTVPVLQKADGCLTSEIEKKMSWDHHIEKIPLGFDKCPFQNRMIVAVLPVSSSLPIVNKGYIPVTLSEVQTIGIKQVLTYLNFQPVSYRLLLPTTSHVRMNC